MIDLNQLNNYKWTDLNYFEFFEIEIAIDALSKLNENQEKSLEESKIELDKSINKIKDLKGFDKQEKEQFIHDKFNFEETVINKLQTHQRYSMIIIIYSFYESVFKSLCTMIVDENNFKKKLNDLYYKGELRKFCDYIDMVSEIKIDKLEEIYNNLNQGRLLRNAIVHSDGVLKESCFNRIKISKGVEFLKQNNGHKLIVERDTYVAFLLENINSFFKILLLLVDKDSLK